MEAIFTRALDLAYVGPSPTVNAHLRTRGDDIRIVAGSCSGGAALVVQPDARIQSHSDFRGRKIATPELGNTQDVAARAWLKSMGLRITLTGGDALVIPTPTYDQIPLFIKRGIDAVWTVEPWVSRLVLEANGKIYFEESKLWPETSGRYVTTHLVSSSEFLQKHTGILKKWIAAHVELTEWVKAHSKEAKELLNQELKAETSRSLPQNVLDHAWERIELTHDPVAVSFLKSAEQAHQIGFLREKPDLTRLYDLRLLNQVLRDRNLPQLAHDNPH